MTPDLRKVLCTEASVCLQPVGYLQRALVFKKRHTADEVWLFHQKGRPADLALSLKAALPYSFSAKTLSSENWAFALGLLIVHHANSSSIGVNRLFDAVVSTFPNLQLSFEPTPFSLYLALETAIGKLRENSSFVPRPLPQHQTPIGAPPPKRPRVFSPYSSLPVGGSLTSADFGAEHLSLDHVELRTINPPSFHNRMSLILESDPASNEPLPPPGEGSTHHIHNHLFDSSAMTSSPIEPVWNYYPAMD